MNDALEAGSACSLSHRERGGVRGFELSISGNPLSPTLSPNGERENPPKFGLWSQCGRKG